ncbi:MAG TPA: DUF4058 family protein [Urbifossiella sp.]|nr:DUF4058 family protein [Urbifossiella sp.]
MEARHLDIDGKRWLFFHGVRLYQIRHVLNTGVLPSGYCALNDQVAYPLGPDVLALRPPEPVGPPAPAGGTALAVSPPAGATTTTRAAKQLRRRAYRRLNVRHVSGHRVVAVVELMSPGNKSSPRDFTAFVDKAVSWTRPSGSWMNG